MLVTHQNTENVEHRTQNLSGKSEYKQLEKMKGKLSLLTKKLKEGNQQKKIEEKWNQEKV